MGRSILASFGERALSFARAHRLPGPGYDWTENPAFSVFHNAPAAIVISGREDLAQALEECTRAGQILDIAANARGLGVCWVGSPILWLRDPATRAELGIGQGWLPCATFAVGFPDETNMPPRPARPPTPIDWIS